MEHRAAREIRNGNEELDQFPRVYIKRNHGFQLITSEELNNVITDFSRTPGDASLENLIPIVKIKKKKQPSFLGVKGFPPTTHTQHRRLFYPN